MEKEYSIPIITTVSKRDEMRFLEKQFNEQNIDYIIVKERGKIIFYRERLPDDSFEIIKKEERKKIKEENIIYNSNKFKKDLNKLDEKGYESSRYIKNFLQRISDKDRELILNIFLESKNRYPLGKTIEEIIIKENLDFDMVRLKNEFELMFKE